ncbi:MAG: hemolysin III family protein [Planctomycetota bacterium]
MNGLPAEPFAAASHLLGAVGALALVAPLLRRGAGCPRRGLVLGLFTASVTLQLVVSGVYHWLAPGTPARALLQRLDHAAIWLAVAGCFLPLRHYLLPARLGRPLQVAVAAIALTGLLLETALHAWIPSWVVVLLYVVFGSIGTPIAVWLVSTRGLRWSLPFFLCGVAFSLGALLELSELDLLPGRVGYHDLVHLCVLAGFGLHWVFVARLTAEAAGALPAEPTPALVVADAS